MVAVSHQLPSTLLGMLLPSAFFSLLWNYLMLPGTNVIYILRARIPSFLQA